MSLYFQYEKSKILYTIRDLALMIGISDNAIRQHIFRRTGFLPEPIRIGTRQLLWTQEQLIEHFRGLVPKADSLKINQKKGRPTKRHALNNGNTPNKGLINHEQTD